MTLIKLVDDVLEIIVREAVSAPPSIDDLCRRGEPFHVSSINASTLATLLVVSKQFSAICQPLVEDAERACDQARRELALAEIDDILFDYQRTDFQRESEQEASPDLPAVWLDAADQLVSTGQILDILTRSAERIVYFCITDEVVEYDSRGFKLIAFMSDGTVCQILAEAYSGCECNCSDCFYLERAVTLSTWANVDDARASPLIAAKFDVKALPYGLDIVSAGQPDQYRAMPKALWPRYGLETDKAGIARPTW